MKSRFHQTLEAQRETINQLQADCSTAKTYYSRSMSNLETISNEIHSRRHNKSTSRPCASGDTTTASVDCTTASTGATTISAETAPSGTETGTACADATIDSTDATTSTIATASTDATTASTDSTTASTATFAINDSSVNDTVSPICDTINNSKQFTFTDSTICSLVNSLVLLLTHCLTLGNATILVQHSATTLSADTKPYSPSPPICNGQTITDNQSTTTHEVTHTSPSQDYCNVKGTHCRECQDSSTDEEISRLTSSQLTMSSTSSSVSIRLS